MNFGFWERVGKLNRGNLMTFGCARIFMNFLERSLLYLIPKTEVKLKTVQKFRAD